MFLHIWKSVLDYWLSEGFQLYWSLVLPLQRLNWEHLENNGQQGDKVAFRCRCNPTLLVEMAPMLWVLFKWGQAKHDGNAGEVNTDRLLVLSGDCLPFCCWHETKPDDSVGLDSEVHINRNSCFHWKHELLQPYVSLPSRLWASNMLPVLNLVHVCAICSLPAPPVPCIPHTELIEADGSVILRFL